LVDIWGGDTKSKVPLKEMDQQGLSCSTFTPTSQAATECARFLRRLERSIVEIGDGDTLEYRGTSLLTISRQDPVIRLAFGKQMKTSERNSYRRPGTCGYHRWPQHRVILLKRCSRTLRVTEANWQDGEEGTELCRNTLHRAVDTGYKGPERVRGKKKKKQAVLFNLGGLLTSMVFTDLNGRSRVAITWGMARSPLASNNGAACYTASEDRRLRDAVKVGGMIPGGKVEELKLLCRPVLTVHASRFADTKRCCLTTG